MGVAANVIDTFYYPVEKICWLAEHNCLTLKDPDRWDTIGSIFWVLSIYMNWMRYVFNNYRQKSVERYFVNDLSIPHTHTHIHTQNMPTSVANRTTEIPFE